MTAKLVYLRGNKPKCNMQVWRFDPAKALKPRKDIVFQLDITDEEADAMSLKELEAKYGSVIPTPEQ